MRQATVREGLIAHKTDRYSDLWVVYSGNREVGSFQGGCKSLQGRTVVPVTMFGLADRAEARFAVDESAMAIWDEREK